MFGLFHGNGAKQFLTKLSFLWDNLLYSLNKDGDFIVDESDFLGFLQHQIDNSDDGLMGEFLLLGNNILREDTGSRRVARMVTGMALASMGLCRDFDPEGFPGFLLALEDYIEREHERLQDMTKPPVVQ